MHRQKLWKGRQEVMADSRSEALEESEAFEAVTFEEGGLLKNVKLLGLRSRNKRNYDTPGVRKTAPQLLEGARIFIDHPETAQTPRSYRDAFGVALNYRYIEGKGHFGDVKYNPEHPLAKQFEWDAKNNPAGLGMSINSTYRGNKVDKNGDLVVESLEHIRSVDIVCKPATANGLFESESEDEIMNLEDLKTKHPDLVTQLLKDSKQSMESDGAIETLRKELKEAKEALEAEQARIKAIETKSALEAEYAVVVKDVSWIDETLRKDILECACSMAEGERPKYKGIVERLVKAAPAVEDETNDDEDADDEADTEEQEEEKPLPRGGKKKTGKFSLRAALGVK
jgi:hypothetical protein